jgi:hypothetical protein
MVSIPIGSDDNVLIFFVDEKSRLSIKAAYFILKQFILKQRSDHRLKAYQSQPRLRAAHYADRLGGTPRYPIPETKSNTPKKSLDT